MRAMKKLAALGAAVLLASCGGGDSGRGFSSLVSFGDSLSDVGTYQVGTVAALGGGKFTVNGAGARIWTEKLAATLQVSQPCPAQKGLLPNIPGVTGAPVTNQAACTNYAQGSARVTHPLGPNAAGLQAAPFNQVTLGLMAVPVTTQVANHLSKVGSFSGGELVTLLAGGNDIFMNLNGVQAAAAGGATAVGGALAAGWSQQVQAAVAAGGAAATSAAATAAVAAMAQAGGELATLIRTQLLAKGARFVVVVNLPDVALTPFGLRLDATTRGLITNMTNAFNAQLAAGLANSGVLYVDFFAQQRAVAANPASFGLTNITTEACDPAHPANPFQGSSLTCTEATLLAGTNGWQYADGVHPSPLGHGLISAFVEAQMRAVGWL